jgi:predicted ATPase
LGYPDQALAKGRSGVEFARTLPHAHSQAHALSYASAFYQVCHDVAAVETLSEQAIVLCAEHGYPVLQAYATITHGWAVLKQGDQEAGLAEIRQGLADFWATDSFLWQPYFQAVLAEVYEQTGQIEPGLENVAEALAIAEKTRLVFWNAELYRLRGKLRWRQGDIPAAEASFQQAIESARSQQARMLELRATLELCRLWQQQGQGETAHRMLSDIYTWFSEGFDTPDLKQARALLEKFT